MTHGLVGGHATVGAVVLNHRSTGVSDASMVPTVSSQGDLTLRVVSWGDLATRSSAAAVVEGGDLGLNTTAVGGCSNLRKNRPDRLNETVLLVRSSVLQSSLDDIVGKGVTKEALHLLGNQKLFNNHVPRNRLGATEALLDHIGAELVA